MGLGPEYPGGASPEPEVGPDVNRIGPNQPSGWIAPAPGMGRPAQYAAPAWGYQPAYAAAAYAPPGPAPGLQWAGIAVRLGALLIDAVIVAGSEIVLSAALAGGSASSEWAGSGSATFLSLVWWLFALSYFPACWYIFGASLGQKVLGLRVVRAADGLPLEIGAVLVRYLIFFTATIVFPIGIVSGIVARAEPHKRAWHDDVAGTVVVRRY